MKLTNEEKLKITWRVVDSLYEKLASELEYELEEHNDFTETNDAYFDLFNEMTIKIVKYMRSELFQPMTNEDLKQ
jgi:transcriptional regulator